MRLKSLFTESYELEQRVKSLEIALIHAKNDLEQLRATTIRKIEAEVDLLQDGLSAIRRDPPKVHVMDDHAERAIDGLRNIVNMLDRPI